MNVLSTFGAVFVGVLVYIIALVLIGGILEEDMARIPMVGRFGIKVLRKAGVFKQKDNQEVH